MSQKDLSEVTDQKLLDESKKASSNTTVNAVLIGFLVGILLYSIMVNSIGFLSLIPLIIIFKLIKRTKNNEAIEKC